MSRKFICLVACAISLLSQFTYAQASYEDLPQKTVDPTAPLPAITLRADHSPRLWYNRGTVTSYNLAVANPYFLWRQANLLHVSIPYLTATGMPSGLGSSQVTNLVIFKQPWGRFGVGAVASLSTPKTGRQGIQYGPSLGFTRTSGKCLYGLLNLNYFNDATSLSAAQLIAGCSVGLGWTISSGSFTWIYDWRTRTFLDKPLSLQVGRVVNVGGQSLQFFINPQYNVREIQGSARWTISIGITFVASPI